MRRKKKTCDCCSSGSNITLDRYKFYLCGICFADEEEVIDNNIKKIIYRCGSNVCGGNVGSGGKAKSSKKILRQVNINLGNNK